MRKQWNEWLSKVRLLFGGLGRRPRGIAPVPGATDSFARPSPFAKLSSFDWEKIYRKSFLYNSIAIVISAYFVADFAATAVLPLLPAQEAPRPRPVVRASNQRGLTAYEGIFAGNAFSEQVRTLDADERGGGFDGPPVKTSLPLNLLGVIVLQDELKSVASVEDKGANQVMAVRVNENISPGARVRKIEPDRVIFENEQSERLEFIELPKELVTASIRSAAKPGTGGGGIQREGNRFAIPRTEVDKTLENLNEVLTQARCVPNFEGGRPAGYRCFQIVPGSIYDKLGMKDNDVIVAINGEPISDPSKAFTMLTELKNSNTRSIELTLNRNGRILNMNYDIN